MRDFRNLRVWHEAKDFCVAVYRATARFPREETYGFTSQLRRSARSIPANIAEGCGYLGRNDSAKFFQISVGSSCECLSDMLITQELGLLDQQEFGALESLLIPTRKQLIRLIHRTRIR